ncbi:3-methylcrotonyl-CoA carboxylase [Endozoicomonas sp. OPT23]|uniref:acetyl/propionyl/methylcrotonyl-CoA carboxylase subunit alpha n=1 Tax=Endozoicomonas sp. OPT23 TaxID=2072845 RepID=UPI00129ACAEC|nr:biotin carboxylase N-terminal domain-containing protein [Endozoicomonas sp. OPT23]MRI34054.1 3-methylcrotonyl-CoA carboxylase [Endozoicomonas sp. OPT23]
MFSKILIANRGEIACRVIETAQKLGIKTVAVYSDSDYKALHVQLADEAVYLGPSSAIDSYLQIDKVIAAAKQTGASAIHPGYGFLSENADFAEACQQQKIQFIGPTASAIRAMGSKSEAKALMAEAGVPMLPGYHGSDQSDESLINKAESLGCPLMIKAAMGGGGKGMRVIHDLAELEAGLAAAKRESLKSFGDDRLLLERFVTRPRHIEVQIFFDQQGNGVFLFDRDCSLQRRHQKVIEEAPAPGLSSEIRFAMGEAAVNAGRAINYQGAGTVEFLLDGNQFYFMEMNTRLQVEHPVTEMVTGIDLVEWQLEVASGLPLQLSQEDLNCTGNAVEVRLYAEDPDNSFLPSSGRIHDLRWPEISDRVRVDTGIQQGDHISSHYDPMLAKLIAWGEDRQQAIANLSEALAGYQQSGLADNRDFLLSLLSEPDFIDGQLSTGFIDEHPVTELNQQKTDLAVAAAALYWQTQSLSEQKRLSQPLNTNQYLPKLMSFTVQEQLWPVKLENKDNKTLVSLPSGQLLLDASVEQQRVTVELEAQKVTCRVVAMPDSQLKVFFNDFSLVVSLPVLSHSQDQIGAMTAPMNGTVTNVMVQPGEEVGEGKALLILEAMKMEHTIKAPKEGVIASVFYQSGDQVEAGASLLSYKDEADVA